MGSEILYRSDIPNMNMKKRQKVLKTFKNRHNCRDHNEIGEDFDYELDLREFKKPVREDFLFFHSTVEGYKLYAYFL